uniref:N-acetyltransferase domain-containing protein n=1 Tax=Rhizophora mucronata TaxID=61149 RepID=A0A2P2JVR9_RHIMU
MDMFLSLENLVGKRIVCGVGLTWTLMKSMQSEKCELNLWSENQCKLNLALQVMSECFEPLKDAYTGRDILEDVIFSRGSDLNRLNFVGFYTVRLEKNDELVTVANVRVLGDKVAEVPLIGTRFEYCRRGMCASLMDELEKQLMKLGVERLILPATPSALGTWIGAFGFSKLADSDRNQYLDHNFLNFPGTTLCEKVLQKSPSWHDLVASNQQTKQT